MRDRVKKYCFPDERARDPPGASPPGTPKEEADTDWIVLVEDTQDQRASGPPPPSDGDAKVLVVAPPESGADVVAGLVRGVATVSHVPFTTASEPALPPIDEPFVVLQLTRNPIHSYCTWKRHHPDRDVSAYQYAHRWLALHQHWAARDDLPVVRLKYEHFLRRDLHHARPFFPRDDDAAWGLVDDAARDDELQANLAVKCNYTDDDLASIHATLGPALRYFGYAVLRGNDTDILAR